MHLSFIQSMNDNQKYYQISDNQKDYRFKETNKSNKGKSIQYK